MKKLTFLLLPIFGVAQNTATANVSVTLIHDHITTFSTVGYKVSVKYSSSDLEPNTIGVKADGVNGVNYTPVNITDVSQTLIDSPLGKGKKYHNVEYTVNGGLWDKPSGDYNTVVQYEIVAR